MSSRIAGSRNACEIYAQSQGGQCQGDECCHYCSAPCTKMLTHGEFIPPLMGRPTGPGHRARPGSPFICVGCWMWRRKRVTASYLSGGLKDGIQPRTYDWLITPTFAHAVTPDCKIKLLSALLNPPLCFALCLSQKHPKENNLQCCPANDLCQILADTPLKFAIDDVCFTYTVYELEQAAVGGSQGKEAGARELVRLLGPVPECLTRHVAGQPPRTPEEQDKGRGRPPVPPPDPRVDEQKRPVTVSGRPQQFRKSG